MNGRSESTFGTAEGRITMMESVKTHKTDETPKDGGIVLSAYLNHTADPQRRRAWQADISHVQRLAETVHQHGASLLLFHNCFPDHETRKITGDTGFIQVKPQIEYQPAVHRWFCYLDYLKKNYHPFIFMTDSTDVEMLRNPFPEMRSNTLYCGDEYNRRLNAPYIEEKRHYVQDSELQSFLDQNRHLRLLNAGICGGDYETLNRFLTTLTNYHKQYSANCSTSTDMPIFNYIVRRHFNDILDHGPHINTRFKKFEYRFRQRWPHRLLFPLTPWFKHK